VKKRTFHEQGATLTLLDRGTHYELMIGHVPILSSAILGTEREFGRLAKKLCVRDAPRILIGGLGFGSTLLGVLESVGPGAEVIVVERLATVIKLMRGELAALADGALADPRVRLVRGDVAIEIARARDLDAILLDVDNGPDWGSFHDNARLYNGEGLRAARGALIDGGAYAVWSGYPADAFLAELRRARFHPKVIELTEHGRVQARAYVGTKRD
jgi:spermidine synthase